MGPYLIRSPPDPTLPGFGRALHACIIKSHRATCIQATTGHMGRDVPRTLDSSGSDVYVIVDGFLVYYLSPACSLGEIETEAGSLVGRAWRLSLWLWVTRANVTVTPAETSFMAFSSPYQKVTVIHPVICTRRHHGVWKHYFRLRQVAFPELKALSNQQQLLVVSSVVVVRRHRMMACLEASAPF